jgi:hypothetical protein
MGINNKQKYKTRRKKFGQGCGRNSSKAKKMRRCRLLAKVMKYKNHQFSTNIKPYQIVRKQSSSNGKYYTKLLVKRLPIVKLLKSKLCRISRLKTSMQK